MRPLLPLLLLLACGPEIAPAPSPAREPVIHVHIPDKLTEATGRFKADWSFDLVTGLSWSAHVHVIPQGQLVPAHRHPDNDELVFVAAGEGWWMGHHWNEGDTHAPRGPGSEAMGVGYGHPGVRSPTWEIHPGDAVLSPAGSVHAVRNREPAPLATVVIQRPEFGQNWYLLPEEVRSPQRSREFRPQTRAPATIPGVDPQRQDDPVFEGWSIDWIEPPASAPDSTHVATETLYLASRGGGSLTFEQTTLPVVPGTFIKVPPGLAHGLEPGSDGLELLRVRIPR